MVRRISAMMALLAFAFCLLEGIAAQNTFATTLVRSLKAMAATMVIGLIIGWMAQKMLEENIKSAEKAEIEAKGNSKDR